jgi:ATP-dependent DNA ligase
MVKVKEHKAADCVVVGVRWKGGDTSEIATLLLGLYREDGGLDYVGSCAVAARSRAEVAARVLPLLDPASDRRFSEPNRWGSGELEEAAVKPELVVEVRYDKLQGNRIRTTARGASCAPLATRTRRRSSRSSRVRGIALRATQRTVRIGL